MLANLDILPTLMSHNHDCPMPNDDEKIGKAVFIYGKNRSRSGISRSRAFTHVKRALLAASNRPHIISVDRSSLFFVGVKQRYAVGTVVSLERFPVRLMERHFVTQVQADDGAVVGIA